MRDAQSAYARVALTVAVATNNTATSTMEQSVLTTVDFFMSVLSKTGYLSGYYC